MLARENFPIKTYPALLLFHFLSIFNYLKLLNFYFKIARIECDLSQEQLAEKVGVARQTIGLIEAGNYNPSINLCIEICKALNKTLDELFWPVDL